MGFLATQCRVPKANSRGLRRGSAFAAAANFSVIVPRLFPQEPAERKTEKTSRSLWKGPATILHGKMWTVWKSPCSGLVPNNTSRPVLTLRRAARRTSRARNCRETKRAEPRATRPRCKVPSSRGPRRGSALVAATAWARPPPPRALLEGEVGQGLQQHRAISRVDSRIEPRSRPAAPLQRHVLHDEGLGAEAGGDAHVDVPRGGATRRPRRRAL